MMAPRTAAGVGAVAFEEIERLQVNDMPWMEVNSGLPHRVFLNTLNRDRETGANLMLVHEPPGFRGSGGGRPHYLPVD